MENTIRILCSVAICIASVCTGAVQEREQYNSIFKVSKLSSCQSTLESAKNQQGYLASCDITNHVLQNDAVVLVSFLNRGKAPCYIAGVNHWIQHQSYFIRVEYTDGTKVELKRRVPYYFNSQRPPELRQGEYHFALLLLDKLFWEYGYDKPVSKASLIYNPHDMLDWFPELVGNEKTDLFMSVQSIKMIKNNSPCMNRVFQELYWTTILDLTEIFSSLDDNIENERIHQCLHGVVNCWKILYELVPFDSTPNDYKTYILLKAARILNVTNPRHSQLINDLKEVINRFESPPIVQ